VPRFVLPLLVLGDVAICVVLYLAIGWPGLLVAIPLLIMTIVVTVVLQGSRMLREAAAARLQGRYRVAGEEEDPGWSGSGPADWDDAFDTFAPGRPTWDHSGQPHHDPHHPAGSPWPSSSSDHHGHSHSHGYSHSHDPGSWSSSDSGSSWSDSGSSSSDSGSSSSSSD